MTSVESALRHSDERRDPREVFREFLDHLGRVSRRAPKDSQKVNGASAAGKN